MPLRPHTCEWTSDVQAPSDTEGDLYNIVEYVTNSRLNLLYIHGLYYKSDYVGTTSPERTTHVLPA